MEVVKTLDKNGRELYFRVTTEGKKVRVSKEVAKMIEKPLKKIYKGYIYTYGAGVSLMSSEGEIFLTSTPPWAWEEPSPQDWEMSLPNLEIRADRDVKWAWKHNWGTRRYIPFTVQVWGRKYASEDGKFVLKYSDNQGAIYIGPTIGPS